MATTTATTYMPSWLCELPTTPHQEIEETPSKNGKEEEMPSNNGKEEDESPRRQRRQKVEEPLATRHCLPKMGSISNQTLSAEDATQAKKVGAGPRVMCATSTPHPALLSSTSFSFVSAALSTANAPPADQGVIYDIQ